MSDLRDLLKSAPPNHWPSPEAGPVVVGMSGGVDSSVTAWLLKELGHEVIGITAHLFGGFPGSNARDHVGCCSLPGSEDARRVATHLGIPFYVLNLTTDFQRAVLEPFADGYLAGETPSPCIECNRGVKFGPLLKKAQGLGAAWLATGHYARIVTKSDSNSLTRALASGTDAQKDQAYFLYFLDQPQMARLGFPLGSLTKSQVRDLARAAALPVAEKPESQDLCFVEDHDYAAAVEALRPGQMAPGPIRTITGQVVGEHQGLARYTIGQRKGLGIAWAEPLFVVGKDLDSNVLLVAPRAEALVEEVLLDRFIASVPSDIEAPFRCLFRDRHRAPLAPALCLPDSAGGARIVLDDPIVRPAPGQAGVCYVETAEGLMIRGGGTIAPAWRATRPVSVESAPYNPASR